MKPTNNIGYHVGHVDDDYDNSSKNKEYNEICQKAIWLEPERGDEPLEYNAYTYENIYNYETNEMSTKILAYGTKEDMWNLERDLHNKYNVDTSDKYFNLKKSLGAYKTIRVDDLDDLIKSEPPEEFNDDSQTVNEKKEQIKKLETEANKVKNRPLYKGAYDKIQSQIKKLKDEDNTITY